MSSSGEYRDPCANNPAGFQWFPIPYLDGSSEAESALAAGRSSALLNAWLDERRVYR